MATHIDEIYNELILDPTGGGNDPLDLGLEIPEYGEQLTELQDEPLKIEDFDAPENYTSENSGNIIRQLLESKGLNADAIKIANEEGVVEEVNFDTLSPEEQLTILDSVSEVNIEDHLDEDEIDILNFMRENNMKLEEAIEYFKNQGIEEFLQSQQASSFNVDDFSDEDIYVLDLKSKFEDLTEEEVELELEKQLENPELFKKKVDKIREELRESNRLDIENAEQERAEQEQQMLEELQSNLVNVATSIEDIGGLQLDDNDKEEVLSLILDRDVNNSSKLLKYLDDPETLFKVSWFVLYGEEAFNTIHDYWKSEIEKIGSKQPILKTQNGSSTSKKVNVIPTTPSENHFGKKGKVTSVDDLWK